MSAQGESGNKLELGGKNVKEVVMSVMSGLLEEDARTWSHPHWDTLMLPSQSCSLCVNARDCMRLALGLPLPLLPGRGVSWHLLP